MPLPGENVCIRCCFSPPGETETAETVMNIDLFYAGNDDLLPVLKECNSVISENERRRAGKFISATNRETFILAHASLRVCLSEYLNTKPAEILFETTENSKPFIADNPVYFNISHTNKAFVIAIARRKYVGADIEEIVEMSDIRSIAMNFFSTEEQSFIFSDREEIYERFFLLWTRKESLLKAIGTGMVNRLNKLEVSSSTNFIDRDVFEDLVTYDVSPDHYIYSFRESGNYISVTAPQRAEIAFFHLKPSDFKRYF